MVPEWSPSHFPTSKASIDDRLIDHRPHLPLIIQVDRWNDLREIDDDQLLLGVDPIGGVIRAGPRELSDRAGKPGGGRVMCEREAQTKALAGTEVNAVHVVTDHRFD